MKEPLVAKKSNALVASRHKLNCHQQRLFLLFVSKIRAQDTPDKEYKLKASEIEAVSKGFLNTAAKIKTILKAMNEKSIDLSHGDTFEQANYFSHVKYEPSTQTATLKVDATIHKELFDLKEKFTLVDLQCTLNLDSPYYISLYELLKSKEFRGKAGRGVDIDLENLKFILGCDGKPTYDLWTGFKRCILDKAEIAFKKHTDTTFTFEAIKTGRKVTGVRFAIKENKTWQPTLQSLLKKETPAPRSKPKLFASEGDTIEIGEDVYIVGPSGIERDGKTFTIGQLTQGIKSGKINLLLTSQKG